MYIFTTEFALMSLDSIVCLLPLIGFIEMWINNSYFTSFIIVPIVSVRSTTASVVECFILNPYSRVTLYTAGHLHTAVPHCSHSRAPIVHTAVPRENNEHGCVYLRCRAVCKLPGCVEGHPWYCCK